MITISAGQCLTDVCLQELGTVDALFELADANGLAITDELSPGQLLVVPAAVAAQPEVAAYFASRQQRINTQIAVRASRVIPPLEPGQKYFDADYFNPNYYA